MITLIKYTDQAQMAADYLANRTSHRIENQGFGFMDAFLGAAASVDPDLYTQILCDRAKGEEFDEPDLYLLDYYNNPKCPAFKEEK